MPISRFWGATHMLRTSLFPRKLVKSSQQRICSSILLGRTARNYSSIPPPQQTYEEFDCDQIEEIELYEPGGLHPVAIGDTLNHGRYHLVHKLGSGALSTVWLARDLMSADKSNKNGHLVSIKIMSASTYKFPPTAVPWEQKVSQTIRDFAAHRGRNDVRSYVLFTYSSFTEVGPNGTHTCLVSSVAGPNLHHTCCFGHGVFRTDLARKICRQVTEVVQLIHAAGYVHGGRVTFSDRGVLPDPKK
jgi:serine/threonine-protein kinase SRPK3